MLDETTSVHAPGVIDRNVGTVVDRLLFERGELDPVECLVDLGVLPAARATPSGRVLELESALLVPAEQAVMLLEQAQAYARAQGLSVISGVSPSSSLLEGTSRRLVELCGCRLRRTDLPQSDLFHDGAWVATLRDLRDALTGQQVETAREAMRRLRGSRPDLRTLEDYERLLGAIEADATRPAWRMRQLEVELAPLARRCLGVRAQDYLGPLWSKVAATLTGTSFVPDTPNLHASYAYAQARQWEAAARSVEAEPEWPEHAALVARLADARARLGQADAARRAWAELCWRHPQVATEILLGVADPVVAALWGKFLDADIELGVEDFPAWLLVADPSQRGLVPADLAPGNATGRAYAVLHRVVTSGALDARVALHALRPDLLRLYLAGRELRGE